MKKYVLLLSVSVIFSLTGCADPEREANVVFVEASQKVQAAQSLGNRGKYESYTAALKLLDGLNDTSLKGTQASLKVASQEKIGGLSKIEIEQEIRRLEATPAVCVLSRKVECLVKALEMAILQPDVRDNAIKGKAVIAGIVTLELIGASDEASRITADITKRFNLDNGLRNSEFAQFMGFVLASFVGHYDEAALTSLYARAISVDRLKGDEESIERLKDVFLTYMDPGLYPNLTKEILLTKASRQTAVTLASKIIDEYKSNDFGVIDDSILLAILKQVSSFDESFVRTIAARGSRELGLAKSVLSTEREKAALEQSIFESDPWRLDAVDRLRIASEAPMEVLRGSHVLDALRILAENPNDVKNTTSLSGKLRSLAPEVVILQKVFPYFEKFIAGTMDVSEFIAILSEQVAMGPWMISSDYCILISNIVGDVGRADLLLKVTEVCKPTYQSSSGPSAVIRSIIRNASLLGAEDASKIVDLIVQDNGGKKLSEPVDLPIMQSNVKSVWTVIQNTERSVIDSMVYEKLLNASLYQDDLDPMEVWDEATNRKFVLKFPSTNGTAVFSRKGNDFLDKIVSERAAEFISSTQFSKNREIQQKAFVIDQQFALIGRDRLLRLIRSQLTQEGRNSVLDALAFNMMESDPADVVAAVWDIPEDLTAAINRLSLLMIGENLKQLPAAK